MHLIYSALMATTLVLTLPYWLVQMARNGKYRRGLAERLGRVPEYLKNSQSGAPVIWVHAVSVGEVLAVAGLIRTVREKFPDHRVVVSTTTATGRRLARERFGDQNVFFFPLDFAFAIHPYLRALQPKLVMIAETEFWPNFLRLAKKSGAHIVVVNARISDRSFPRYRRYRNLVKWVLSPVDHFLAQSELDAGRLVDIGADKDRVQVSGNLKFDIIVPKESAAVAGLRSALRTARAESVIVAGSTVEGEEKIILDAFRQVRERVPKSLLILAPRHPERFGGVADMLSGTEFRFWRRSKWQPVDQKLYGQIMLLDSIGELASFYSLATIAIVGGSFVPRGGHNILEPASFGVPIIVGKYTENFREIIDLFTRAGAVDIVEAEDLGKEMTQLLFHEEKRQLLGQHAAAVVRGNSGATAKTLAVIEQVLGPGKSVEPSQPVGSRS